MEVTMTVAKCPDCGTEVTTEDIEQPMRLVVALGALMVVASHLENLMQLPEYAAINGSWSERLDAVTAGVIEEAGNMQGFGETFDREDDDGEEEANN